MICEFMFDRARHERAEAPALRAFLREHRSRISPRDAGLPERPGRRLHGLSAEDIAEMIGVSARWYLEFEKGYGTRRFSQQFLERVAAALQLNEQARFALYRLAKHTSLAEDSRAVLDAFGWLRRIRRRLWVATSEIEALTVASGAVADYLGDSDFIGSYTRLSPGIWRFPTLTATERIQQRVQSALGDIFGSLTPEEIDEAMLSRLLVEPGQTGTKAELYKGFRLASQITQGFERAGFPDAGFVMAHVRSQGGFEANLFAACLAEPRTFSELELAQMSALGDLTSLALS